MKTIKQIAEEIGVSKQAIFKKIKKEPLSTSLQGFISTIDGRLMVSVDGETLINQEFVKKQPPMVADNQPTTSTQQVDRLIAMLKEELKAKDDQISRLSDQLDTQLQQKDKQLDEKDKQILEVTKLLDQQQQLQMKLQLQLEEKKRWNFRLPWSKRVK